MGEGGAGRKIGRLYGNGVGVTAVRALDYSLGETELGMGWVAGHTEDFNYSLNARNIATTLSGSLAPPARGRRIYIYICIYLGIRICVYTCTHVYLYTYMLS